MEKQDLKEIPIEILKKLKIFLNNKKDYEILEKQLASTGLMIFRDDYQISIKSMPDLKDLYEILNDKDFIN